MNTRLGKAEYLGGEYSIADMAYYRASAKALLAEIYCRIKAKSGS